MPKSVAFGMPDTPNVLGHFGPVDEDEADDFAECQRHDRKIVAAKTQDRETEDDAPQCGKNTGERQQEPERKTEIARQQRVGIGTDSIKGDVTEVEKTCKTDDDVEAPGEHHVDQDLDTEIVHPFEGALRTQNNGDGNRVNQEKDKRHLQEMGAKKTLLGRDLEFAVLGLGQLAAIDLRPDENDRDETADGGDRDENREQTPALNDDQLVADVLVGLQADIENEHAQ
jgi:hypothetical protein